MAACTFYERLQCPSIDTSHRTGVKQHIGLFTSCVRSRFGIHPPYGGTVKIGGTRCPKVGIISRRGRCGRGDATTTVLDTDRMIVSEILGQVCNNAGIKSSTGLIGTRPDARAVDRVVDS